MVKIKRENILIVLAVILFVAIGVLVNNYEPATENRLGERSIYTNEKGEEWGIPKGEWSFKVTAAEVTGPVFLEGEIDPLDVHPGDTQKMKVVVQDAAGVASVVAEIETDNGINSVSLERTGTVTFRELLPEKYAVLNGTFKILSPFEIETRRLGGQVAQASGGEKEVWEGSWVVRDTHVRTYHTTFVATNNLGEKNSFTMAWSDPCNLPAFGNFNVTLSDDCTLGGIGEALVDGWDGGNITIQGSPNPVNVSFVDSGGYFVWTPGSSIIMQPGAQLITSGAGTNAFVQECLYYVDVDGDLYSPGGNKLRGNCSPIAGQVRMKDALGHGSTNGDCYDNNVNARPGQISYFSVDRGDGSFDYNCDNTESFNPSQPISNCDPITLEDPLQCPQNVKWYPGYWDSDQIPSCGETRYVNPPGQCANQFCSPDPKTVASSTPLQCL